MNRNHLKSKMKERLWETEREIVLKMGRESKEERRLEGGRRNGIKNDQNTVYVYQFSKLNIIIMYHNIS